MKTAFERLKSKYKGNYWWSYSKKKGKNIMECSMYLILPNYVIFQMNIYCDLSSFNRAEVREIMAHTILIASLDIACEGGKPIRHHVGIDGKIKTKQF